MRRSIAVHVGAAARKVGTLVFESDRARQHSIFTYDDGWIADPEAFPITPSMPFPRRTFFSRKEVGAHSSAFASAIADSCPDAWGQAIIRRDRRDAADPVTDWDYLTGVDDAARMGALRFRDADGTFVRAPEAGRPVVPPLFELDELLRATDAVEARTETAKDVKRLIGNGSSLGGARPKCAVTDADGTLMIAKFTSKADKLAVERMEVATLDLARQVGLTVPDARAIEVAGRAVALIRRFDRGTKGRIHYVSAQTMLERDEATGSSYEEIATELRRHAAAPAASLEELFARVAFTILVSNVDDHVKNHGFAYVGKGQWDLSPLFDVNPSPDRERRLKTTIAEGSGDEASMELLLANARVFDLAKGRADEIVSSMAETISSRWRDAAKATGMRPREITAYEAAFVHDEARIAMKRKRQGPLIPSQEKKGRGGRTD